MKGQSFMWECNCGNVEYGQVPPEECEKCWETNSFVQVPEEMVKDLEEKLVAERKMGFEGDFDDEEEEYEE